MSRAFCCCCLLLLVVLLFWPSATALAGGAVDVAVSAEIVAPAQPPVGVCPSCGAASVEAHAITACGCHESAAEPRRGHHRHRHHRRCRC